MIITGTGYIGIGVIFWEYEGYAYPPIFKCYKRPSFELKHIHTYIHTHV